MLYKTIHIPSVDDKGLPSTQVLTKQASLVKTANPIEPTILDYVRNLTYQPGCLYVIVGAIGASEYWGPNLNADIWPESELDYEGLDYGYKTFLNAMVYPHHQNKDTAKSLGRVLFTAYNKYMHRVELVLEIDKRKCIEQGVPDLVEKLEAGESVDWSMGARVAHDTCTKCGFTTAIPSIRCNCIKTPSIRNSVLPNGIRVGMKNIRPRFFDISYVRLRADNNGLLLENLMRTVTAPMCDIKLASASELQTTSRDTLLKKIELKTASHKIADLCKNVLGLTPFTITVANDSLPTMELADLLNVPFEQLLHTAAQAGIPLNPLEFQTSALNASGMLPLAEALFQRGQHFDPVLSSENPIVQRLSITITKTANAIDVYRPRKSIIEALPSLRKQAKALQIDIAKLANKTHQLNNSVFTKLADSYSAYQHYTANILCSTLLYKVANKPTDALVGDLTRAAIATTALNRQTEDMLRSGQAVDTTLLNVYRNPMNTITATSILMDKLSPAAGTPVSAEETSVLYRLVNGGI